VSIYPLIVAIVSLAFGIIVLSQWMARRRSQQLIWGIALLMAAGASFAFVGFLFNGSELLFRVYYALGALLMAAYLGMGSLYLALSRRVADLILAALVIVSALGVALILVAPLDVAALHRLQHTSGAGTRVLKPGLWLLPLILLNSFGAAAVIGVALYSAYKVLRRQAPVRFAVANVTIAVGTGIVTYAGTAARLGSPNYFWIVMAVGWVVIFAGFLLTLKLAPLARASRDVPMGQGTVGSRR
jgi:hypothetical protein